MPSRDSSREADERHRKRSRLLFDINCDTWGKRIRHLARHQPRSLREKTSHVAGAVRRTLLSALTVVPADATRRDRSRSISGSERACHFASDKSRCDTIYIYCRLRSWSAFLARISRSVCDTAPTVHNSRKFLRSRGRAWSAKYHSRRGMSSRLRFHHNSTGSFVMISYS